MKIFLLYTIFYQMSRCFSRLWLKRSFVYIKKSTLSYFWRVYVRQHYSSLPNAIWQVHKKLPFRLTGNSLSAAQKGWALMLSLLSTKTVASTIRVIMRQEQVAAYSTSEADVTLFAPTMFSPFLQGAGFSAGLPMPLPPDVANMRVSLPGPS